MISYCINGFFSFNVACDSEGGSGGGGSGSGDVFPPEPTPDQFMCFSELLSESSAHFEDVCGTSDFTTVSTKSICSDVYSIWHQNIYSL